MTRRKTTRRRSSRRQAAAAAAAQERREGGRPARGREQPPRALEAEQAAPEEEEDRRGRRGRSLDAAPGVGLGLCQGGGNGGESLFPVAAPRATARRRRERRRRWQRRQPPRRLWLRRQPLLPSKSPTLAPRGRSPRTPPLPRLPWRRPLSGNGWRRERLRRSQRQQLSLLPSAEITAENNNTSGRRELHPSPRPWPPRAPPGSPPRRRCSCGGLWGEERGASRWWKWSRAARAAMTATAREAPLRCTRSLRRLSRRRRSRLLAFPGAALQPPEPGPVGAPSRRVQGSAGLFFGLLRRGSRRCRRRPSLSSSQRRVATTAE